MLPARRDQAALRQLGRADALLRASRPCRSAASCSTCTARAATTWPAIDAICAALQIINHLQDCRNDYRNLDRVYIPLDAMRRRARASRRSMRRTRRPRYSRACTGSSTRTAGLLRDGCVLRRPDRDSGLSLEIAVIQRLARSAGRAS